MRDFYAPNFMTKTGKCAGKESMPEFVRHITSIYDNVLLRLREERKKTTKNDYDLYL